MKICIVSEYYYPTLGGMTEHVYNFAKHALLKGHEVTLMTSEAGKIPAGRIPKGLVIKKFGYSFKLYSNESFSRVTLGPFLGTKIRRFFEENKFDVIHTHGMMSPMLALLAHHYKKCPVVGTMHTYFEESFFYEKFQRKCQQVINAHEGLIAVSQSCIDAMRKYFDIDAEIIPNGIDVDYFSSGKKLARYDDGKFNILFLARLDPRNDLTTLITAFHIMKEKGLNVRLIVAGESILDAFYKNQINPRWKDDIHFLGAVNDERPDLLASSHTFCYPAQKASFGITLLEAMSARVPVVASNIRGFREVIRQDESNGLFFKLGDPEDLANKIEKIYQDKHLQDKLKEAGYQTAQKYTWSKVTDQVLQYYRDKIL